MNDFGLSMASSSTVHVPETYPNDIPTSPNEYPSDIDSQLLDDSNYKDQDSKSNYDKNNEMAMVSNLEDGMENASQHDMGSDNQTRSNDTMDYDLESRDRRYCGGAINIVMHSSSAANVSFILDIYQYSISLAQYQQKNPSKLLSEVHSLCRQMKAYKDTIANLEAQLTASNVHCTLVCHELGDVQTQLDNVKRRKTCGSTKIKAWFLTHPELKEALETEEIECKERERISAVKEA
ncbi:hypothetical protein C0992_004056 [Termitomyces sp. T32_za158]|nr:hypothetical protein C0992_004056 [Termitomyces sp. T32_za158]